ncbi:DNA gyrase subunit A [Adhaeretor mobilis]|uniref:DNA topoisomerase (ATP-hydrolyzing) n=1 Tax=Adhaeretor mobilis TaxID=1930276 RepID=A0A517MPP5_9BACT|nr:DNA gyrase subunit A [Adhaeretor mobilis]QDS96855.1 DNA gyrase subunit A [Adhaeretor mobilis]
MADDDINEGPAGSEEGSQEEASTPVSPTDHTANLNPDGTPGNDAQGNPIVPNFDPATAIAARLIDLPIEDELKDSYLTYAMSVIVSRALPDVRDGLKPSQRRILVAMNDLNLSPGAGRVKCAKISGDTSGNYHPHGESVIYPTLVRMAQEWNLRHTLVDKQGNFGSIAGLPPAAMRYTEARLSSIAWMMLDDLKLDTVDFVPTYDERHMEPTVLPSKFPNLLVNGSGGIAVGMATSIPPHNLGEVCRGVIAVMDNPEINVIELMDIIPGPDFPTGGTICGRSGILKGYQTGRSTVTVRARTSTEEKGKKTRIIVHEIPYQTSRDSVMLKVAALANEGRIVGISDVRDESDLKEPVRIVIELKRDADPDVVLNQLYKFSPLQDTFSLILIALVDGKPRMLTLKEMLEEFLRHRVTVIRRRTQFLLARARKRKHTVQGLLLAHANIDEVIRVIRASKTQPEAKQALMQIKTPGALLKRALGDQGYEQFQDERGVAEEYSLTPVQADAILRMTLGQLVNLEQEKLSDEHAKLLIEIADYIDILGDPQRIFTMIREDCQMLIDKHADERRTEISHEEIGDVNMEDLIEEETMVVSISHQGYIKRTPASVYSAQKRGGKGIKGAKVEEDDPVEHLFVTSTHHYLLFFTNLGKVYWQKVYNLPQLSRDSKGRAIVNLLNLAENEKIADCRAIRDFEQPDHHLLMATRNGLVKKTDLKAYSRPKKTGIIAIKLKEGDELMDVVVTGPGDEVILSTADGMAIRFRASDARSMGRNSSGVKGINLSKGDTLAGMVVADPEATLLTATEKGFGKRTYFGPNAEGEDERKDTSDEISSGNSYRTQNRGGKGLRDIKTTDRNGSVVGICRVDETDELLMMTARGKIQRVKVSDFNVIGRNTQGVNLMTLGDDDSLAAIVRVPKEEANDEEIGEIIEGEASGATEESSDGSGEEE